MYYTTILWPLSWCILAEQGRAAHLIDNYTEQPRKAVRGNGSTFKGFINIRRFQHIPAIVQAFCAVVYCLA